MITLITGAPGAGKSAALVALLSELSKGRTIYAHGIPDFKIEHQPLDDPSKWPDTVPDGSIIVIDEVQTVWRPRGPGQGVPPDIQALETHRHRGLDFYIITQAPRLLHTNVRALVGRHVHLRDVGFLGRYWYEWPECSENCSSAWKSAPIRKRYKLPKSAFGLYRSASVHVKPIRSFPWMLVVAVLALLGTAALAWYSGNSILSKANPTKTSTDAKYTTSAPNMQPKEANSIQHDRQTATRSGAYDQTAFYPQLPNVPESAPAFDHLRVVVNMPRVAGGICGRNGCKCYSEQGTLLGMSSDDCQRLVASPSYDPWRVQVTSQSPAKKAPDSEPTAANPPAPGPQLSPNPAPSRV